VYFKAKENQKTSRADLAKNVMLKNKYLLATDGFRISSIYATDHTALASMRSARKDVPRAGLLFQMKIASKMHVTADTIKAMAYMATVPDQSISNISPAFLPPVFSLMSVITPLPGLST
jgi:hypothetical protein